jgi:[ribosomal protein S5]-alanine N-acetyltransferase
MSAVLETQRLILRAPQAGDVPHFVPLIGDFDVSKNLSRIPHPYTERDGYDFVAMIGQKRTLKQDYAFSILRKMDDAFVGMCGVHPERGWEMGYWIGKPFWRQGYATEVGARLVAFGFDELGAERLFAEWFHDNPASGRVLEKLGFQPSGETMSNCLARGHCVAANVVALDRGAHKTRKNRS